MQCKKCNAPIPEGYLYCPKCGEEIIIVTDFEIKLEDNIDAQKVVEDNLTVTAGNVSAADLKAATKEIPPISQSADKDRPDVKDGRSTSTKGNSSKINLKLVIPLAAAALLFLAGCIFAGVKLYRYFSPDYQYEKGLAEYEAKDYEESVKTLKHLMSLDEGLKGRLLLADSYIELNNYDAAIAVLYNLLDEYPDNVDLYDRIVKCYEAEGDSSGINDLIRNSNKAAIMERYSDYIAAEPVFSLEPGTYTEPDPLTISADGKGKIYYTTDGSVPTEDSISYDTQIILDYGENDITAVFINDKGIVSEPVSAHYTVNADVASNPVLLVKSGTITTPQLIGVTVPDSEEVYYVSGDKTPDMNSSKYTSVFLMPLGKSTYSFIAYNESGTASDVIRGSYDLEMSAIMPEETCEYAISYQLTSMGEDNSLCTYKAEYGYNSGENNYYIISEYLDGKKTDRRFAVDVMSGALFTFTGGNGSYSLTPL